MKLDPNARHETGAQAERGSCLRASAASSASCYPAERDYRPARGRAAARGNEAMREAKTAVQRASPETALVTQWADLRAGV